MRSLRLAPTRLALRSLALGGLVLLSPASADDRWPVRTARMEGASVNIEEAAAQAEETAQSIADSGRLVRMVELLSDAAELNRRVVSAELAAGVLDE